MDKIETLIAALRSGDADRQRRAARKLGYIGDALLERRASRQSQDYQEFCNSVVPALVEALEDENRGVRSEAAFVLGTIGDALLQSGASLQSQDYQEFCNTVVPALIEALKDEVYTVRWSAAASLGKIDDISAGPALVKALGDEDVNVRGRAVEALSEFVSKADAVEELEKVEAVLQDGIAALAKNTDRKVETLMGIAIVMKMIAGKKNKLASKRGVLLDDKPKPPKGGKMYRSLKAGRNQMKRRVI